MSYLFEQLSLAVQLRDEATFDNFFVNNDSLIVDQLRRQLSDGERYIYLFGAQGSGRSHLLQAACHHAEQRQLTSVYLPLEQLQHYNPVDLFEGLQHLALVCVDDIHCVMLKPEWEQQLFHLFNRLADQGARMLIAADCAVRELPITLADLASRLSWGTVFHLKNYSDEQRIQILQFRATLRGMELIHDVAQFVVNRGQRDTASLLHMLDVLDGASLKEKRKLTIPFVKATLGW